MLPSIRTVWVVAGIAGVSAVVGASAVVIDTNALFPLPFIATTTAAGTVVFS